MLKVEQIAFAYGRQALLHEISFDVAPGEIVALLGANGVGKSTLLRLLAGIVLPDRGTISLHGGNQLLRPLKYRRAVGYLAERIPLYHEMRVEEYLVFRARLKGERTLRMRRRINEVVARCNLDGVRATPIAQLSYGFQKRVSLAEALLSNPRLLLLDDLLSGLDRQQRRSCGALLSGLSGRSAIMVAGHELEEMLLWCTRFIVLGEGRIQANLRAGSYERAELIARLDAALGVATAETATAAAAEEDAQ